LDKDSKMRALPGGWCEKKGRNPRQRVGKLHGNKKSKYEVPSCINAEARQARRKALRRQKGGRCGTGMGF
jgi:hypothetical protein